MRVIRMLLAAESEPCLMCEGARSGMSAGLPLCTRCFGRIPWISPDDIRCDTCGRADNCGDCVRRSAQDTWFVHNRSAVRYDAVMKEWLGRFKYRGDERAAELFAGMLLPVLEELVLRLKRTPARLGHILLTYVPLSASRLADRGFNQMELIVKKLGRARRLPVWPLLARTRHTDKQSRLNRRGRLEGLRDAFAVDEQGVKKLGAVTSKKPTVIIVDDVYTTGTTLNECARTINEATNADIYTLTWAR